MKLITKEIAKRFNQLERQESPNPIVVAKFFNPSGSGTWYATEYDPETKICHGFVTGLGYPEWGYFSLTELEQLKCPPFGLKIERDFYTSEQKLSEHLPELKQELERREELWLQESKNKNDHEHDLEQ